MSDLKIAIYIRVSTEDQAKEGYSLEVQREHLESFAKREGQEVYKVYCDEGISAYSTRRPALQELIEDAKAKKFDLVITYKIDRFSRNLKDLLILVDELSSYGVGFKSATEPFDTTTSAGKLMFQQLGSFAEFERNRISERVFPGMVKGVQLGNWQGARFAPFGYKYSKAKKLLEVTNEESKLVKLIFKMYLEGRSTHNIVDYLNKKGYQSRTGKKFYTKFIGDVLKNRIYIGQIVWNKKHYDKNQKTEKHYKYIKNDPSKHIIAQGRHKLLISEEDFEKAQTLLADKKRTWRPRIKNSNYLLSDFFFCSKCNSKYFGSLAISNHRTNAKKRWYRCGGPVHNSVKCKNRSVKASEAEKLVDDLVATLVQNPRFKDNRWMNVTGQNGAISPFSGVDAKKVRKRLSENQHKQAKLTDAYLDNLLGVDVFRDRIENLRKGEDEFKKLIAGIELMELERDRSQGYLNRVKDFIDGYDETIEKVDFALKKQMCGLLFKNIKIAPPIGRASAQKRISFSLFEPFNFLFSEAREKQLCKKNQSKIKISPEESTSVPSDGRWCKYRKTVLGILKGLSGLQA